MAELLRAVALEEIKEPVGEISEPNGVGSHEEYDDSQLGIGYGCFSFGAARKPVYVAIHCIHLFHWHPARSAVRIVGRPPPGLLTLASGQADLDFPGRHLGVFLLANEINLGRPYVGVACEFPHLVHGGPVADGVVDGRLA
jgi:hypothetical protein